MLDKQRQILEEKLDQIISELAQLCTQKEDVNAKIYEIRTLLSEHSRYYKAKSAMLNNFTIFSLCGIAVELFIYLVSDDIFPTISNELFSFEATKWQVTHLVIPFTCAFTILVTSFDHLFDIIRYRSASKIDEEEQNKELASSENLSMSINKQISYLEDRKQTCLNDIKYIDNLPSMLNKILDDVAYLSKDLEKTADIEEILTREFNDFLNEKVDYSKVHLDVVPNIKEYKLKAPK